MPIVSIPLEKLRVSPHNVRKSQNKITFEELKASVQAHGLLQPPLVTKADDGFYEVVDGGRRHAVLQALQKEAVLPKGHPVDCSIAGDSDASELSLAANVMRDAMHPADEFEAFAALAKDHKPFDIAARFGVTERHVLQRLKLGKLAPEILKAYREEKLDLEALMAYTLTDDHNSQRKVFKAQDRYHNAHVIKRLLTENKADADSKLAKFVGLAAYQKAGGKITGDLFGDDQFLDDATLLQKLANEKLVAQAQKLKAEGWGWIEVRTDHDYSFTGKCDEIEAKPTAAPKKLLEKQAKLQAEDRKLDAEMDAASDQDDDDAYESAATKSRKVQEQLAAVDEELEEYRAFDPKEVAAAGCYVTVSGDGKLHVQKGLVKPEDKKAFSKGEPAAANEAKPKEKGISQALLDSLKQQRLQIAQAAIAADADVAFDLLVFKAACDKFTSAYVRTGPEVSFSRNHFRTDMVPDAKGTVAGKELLAAHGKLKLDWLKEKTETAKFEAFTGLSHPQKLEILAYCVAGTLQPQLAEKNAFELAVGLTETNVAEYWRPTAENYLSKITKDQLLKIGGEIFGTAWAKRNSDQKKGDLALVVESAFANPDKISNPFLSEEEKATARAKAKTWLPEGMAFTLPEKKPAKAKKKAA